MRENPFLNGGELESNQFKSSNEFKTSEDAMKILEMQK